MTFQVEIALYLILIFSVFFCTMISRREGMPHTIQKIHLLTPLLSTLHPMMVAKH